MFSNSGLFSVFLTLACWHAFSEEDSAVGCLEQGTCRVEDELALLTLSTEVRVRGKRHALSNGETNAHEEVHDAARPVGAAVEHKLESREAWKDSSEHQSKTVNVVKPALPRHHFNQKDEFRKRERLKVEDYVDERALVANIELSFPSGPMYALVIVMVVAGVILGILLHQQRTMQGAAADKLDSIETNFLYNVCAAFGNTDDVIKVGKDKLDADDISDDGSDCPRAEIVSEDEPECEVDLLVDALEPDCEAVMGMP